MFGAMIALVLHAASGTVCVAASTAVGERAVVVAGHPAATEAGMAVLQDGGNAIDAAVATAMTIGVAEPWGSGIGGKLIMVYFDADSRRCTALEALDQASITVDPEAFANLPHVERFESPAAAAVPGMLAGWAEAHDRWGSRPWAELIQPSVDAAREGILVDHIDYYVYHNKVDRLTKNGGAATFLPDGRAPKPGGVMRFPDLARTMAQIRDEGFKAMYGGTLGERIAEHVANSGGSMSIEDFRRYRAVVRPAPSTPYRGYRVHGGIGPATGGATVLLALACLEEMTPLKGMNETDRLEQIAGVLHEVYPAVRSTLGDTPSWERDLRRMLAGSRIRAMVRDVESLDFEAVSRASGRQPNPTVPAGVTAAAIWPASPIPGVSAMAYESGQSTTHFLVVDGDGNMVSATQSLGYHFGCGVVVPGTGIALNNSMNNFVTRAKSSPNYIQPGRRARSTMSPVIVTRGGEVVMGAGGAGGQRIPTMVINILTGMLDGDVGPVAAIDRPRVHFVNSYRDGVRRRRIDFEQAAHAPVIAELRNRGWDARYEEEASRTYFGSSNLIAREAMGDPASSWIGVGDDRRTNEALGW